MRCVAIALSVFAAMPALALDVEVTNAWVRSTLSGSAITDAYMNLHSTTDLKLVGASTPWAKSVEIRDAGSDFAVGKDATPNVVAVPANKDVTLDAGGYHLALLGVVRDIPGGEWVPITLDFRDAANVGHPVAIKAQARGNMFPPGPPPPELPR
jgi:periplasmic copper chaperone A